MKPQNGDVLGASFIICGTCIGGGMLALPSATSSAGFFPSLVSNFSSWLFMTLTGLLLLEACLWLPGKNNHLPSLAEAFLGKPGKLITCGLFIFLYYCLLISYVSGGAPYFTQFIRHLSDLPALPGSLGICLYVISIAVVLYLGNKVIDRVNLILVFGLFGSFAALVLFGSQAIVSNNLLFQDWPKTFLAAPILFGAYGFHNVIPSLVSYLDKDGKKLRLSIIIGTALPLCVYCLWQTVALGVVSNAELQAAQNMAGIPIVESIILKTDSAGLKYVVYFFSFFAIITSILGVAFSMVDFLADGLKVASNKSSRAFLIVLTLAPPAIIAAIKPNLFVRVFGYASGFGEAILNGCIPIALFWVGYKRLKHQPVFSPLKGNTSLFILSLVALIVIGIETVHLIQF